MLYNAILSRGLCILFTINKIDLMKINYRTQLVFNKNEEQKI